MEYSNVQVYFAEKFCQSHSTPPTEVAFGGRMQLYTFSYIAEQLKLLHRGYAEPKNVSIDDVFDAGKSFLFKENDIMKSSLTSLPFLSKLLWLTPFSLPFSLTSIAALEIICPSDDIL